MRYFVFWICLMLLAGVFTAQSEADTLATIDELAVYSGAVVFANPAYDSIAVVEFPFTLNRDQFQFFQPDSSDSNWYARVFAQVDLMSAEGFPVDSTRTYFSLRVSSPEEAKQKDFRIFNKLVMQVPPGVYTARVTAIDVVSKKTGEYFIDKVIVEPPQKERLSVGGLVFAHRLEYVGTEDAAYNPRLYKNGFLLLANPIGIYSDADSIIYLYGEIYNLKYVPDSASKYAISCIVLDKAGNVYQALGSRVREKKGGSAVISESIDIDGWSTGSYSLQITASDFLTRQADTHSLAFHIISPEALKLAKVEAMTQSPYDSLEHGDRMNLVKYLLTPSQEAILLSLSEQGQENFLDQYWREHDANPGVPGFQTRAEYVRRYLYSNAHFSNNEYMSNGWQTDRGRIYISRGHWDEKDDFEAPRVGNPYEVWYYRSARSGGDLYVFEDWSGSDDYRLVHSTATGEIFSKDWEQLLNEGFIDVYQD